MIERLVVAMEETTDPYKAGAYGQAIASLGGSADAAFGQRMIERLVAAIEETTDRDQTAAYGQAIASLAGSADAAFGQRMIERLAAAIAETTDPYKTGTYEQAIASLGGSAGMIRSTAAHTSTGEWVAGMERSGDRSRIRALGSALVAGRLFLRREVWLFIATEFLKHPLSVSADDLVSSLADHCGLAAGQWRSVWDVLRWLEQHEPWLPLREPFGSRETIRRRIVHLAEHGAPLPA